jgi:hypothetical protein
MMKPQISVVDAITNEQIVREMTDAEFAEYQERQEQAQARQQAIEAKAVAKASAQAKLEALGLTVEDLTALGL